jgi:predicted N-acetyltransferase YhbS
VISLLATAGERIVGHVVLSPMSHADQPGLRGLLGLGPIAVEPALQSRGIGSALTREAIRQARDARVHRLFVLGDPAFYRRFGFIPASEAGFTCNFPKVGDAFQILTLRESRPIPPGQVRYAPAFDRFL